MVTLDKKSSSASRQEPRSYVRPKPLPIASHQGVKIQARSQEVYSATQPSRDDVRRDNYFRRSDQLERRGFSAYNYLPYKGIGDPFYLQEKRLILHALGQWSESDDDDSYSSSGDESIYVDSRPKKVQSRPRKLTREELIPRRYVYKVRRDKSRLVKETKKGREMVRNVRLGHGFFHLIEEQRQQRKREQEQHDIEERDRRQREVQAAAESSSSDDEHDYMVDAVPITCSQSRVSTAPTAPNPSGRSPRSSRPLTGKKRGPPSRPYTPSQSSLLSEEPDTSARGSLFRQLCILHWLLEAMNSDNVTMAPVMTSWNLREMGGQKMTPRKLIQERTTETSWSTFQTTPVNIYPPVPTSKVGKKWGGMRRNLGTPKKLFVGGSRGSIDSTSAGVAGRPTSAKSTSEGSEKESDVDDEILNKSLFSFLDEYYQSLRKDEQSDDPSKKQDGGVDKMAADASSTEKKRHREKRSDEDRASRRSRKTPEPGRESTLTEPTPLTWRAQSAGSIRPRSSPALVEFNQSAMSQRYSNLSRDMNRVFSLVDEEKSVDLKESIQHLERARLKNCRTKFTSLSTNYSTSDKALRHMRQSTTDDKKMEKNKQLSDISPWYNDLLSRIPEEIRQIWYFSAILDKLSVYVENGKVNSIKFQKTLSTLREWEICSPEVAAAIEFCREKIVEMSVEDFEKWFREHFPNVDRPTPILQQVEQATRATSTRSTTRPKTAGSLRSRTT